MLIMDSVSRHHVTLPLQKLKGCMCVVVCVCMHVCVLSWGISRLWLRDNARPGFISLRSLWMALCNWLQSDGLWKMMVGRFMSEERREKGRANTLRSGTLRKQGFNENFKDACFVACELLPLSSPKNFCKNWFYLVSALESYVCVFLKCLIIKGQLLEETGSYA